MLLFPPRPVTSRLGPDGMRIELVEGCPSMLLDDRDFKRRFLARIQRCDAGGLLAQLLPAARLGRAAGRRGSPRIPIEPDDDDDVLGPVGADVLHRALERVDPSLRV